MDFLGFGGARYETAERGQRSQQGQPGFVSEAEFEVYRDEVLADLDGAGRSPYVRLGIRQWPDIPATLEEVREIGAVFNESRIITGADASEQTVVAMQKNGALADYRILHFATHGLALPRFPELSAIVLSQAAGGQKEDGYLNMREISRLSLAADFVNLSACETGLGKIYDGEGVVGLGQAFLTAGAKILALSLWQVADKSTKEFMVGMYRRLHEGQLGYAQAMAAMKRTFIKSGSYSHPFFWAPFIIFGWE
jgi:CHAT domain-containing protein